MHTQDGQPHTVEVTIFSALKAGTLMVDSRYVRHHNGPPCPALPTSLPSSPTLAAPTAPTTAARRTAPRLLAAASKTKNNCQ